MSVPVRKHDGYGLYILEANAAGIPVVQPATGAFPEILEITNGGITYAPDNYRNFQRPYEIVQRMICCTPWRTGKRERIE